jgi:phosphate transport system protein
MTLHLQRDLEDLHQAILSLALEVEGMVDRAILALRRADAALARAVIEGDTQVDEEENRIEDRCLKMIAVHQPVAADLRWLAAVLKINTDLERMADLAVDIAEQALLMADLPPMPIPEKLQRMTDVTTAMVRQSLEAFVRQDTQLARKVCRLDDEADRYNAEIIQELIQVMRLAPQQIEPALALMAASRHLERIADHATNIAEDAIYLVEGEIVRHRPAALPQQEAD